MLIFCLVYCVYNLRLSLINFMQIKLLIKVISSTMDKFKFLGRITVKSFVLFSNFSLQVCFFLFQHNFRVDTIVDINYIDYPLSNCALQDA